ncbi:hypothetical protein Y032_0019g3897 [Ancylostoma ceylanicum]|uniref:Phospholipase A2 n=1 Tax=Ancylostoma ceylanicum TaxID=53326 RepID=A0A016V4D3_9BILA|nr:hypothetical protein Y032_0019g3897 [Ancylostoma ceylanicum]
MLNVGHPIHLVILMRIVTAVDGRLEFDDWHCGSSDFTRRMSFESITENCESIMLPVNHCCVVHDECYTLQLGQEKCDEDFCECNRRATISRRDCVDLLEASCSLVQLFGFGAYHNSANYTEPIDFVKQTLRAENLRKHYSNIYSSCPKVNATTSSCAMQYNMCDETPIECAEELSRCLLDAAAVDGSSLCHESVNEVCDLLVKDANSWRNTLRNSHFLWASLLRIVMGACVVLLLYCVLRLRPSSSTIDEKGKRYFPV